MLTIRLQRGGRKGQPQYRIIAQDSRFSPTSGRYVALLGTYNPHTKDLVIDNDKATKFLNNGAQPSARVAMLLDKHGVELPSWVSLPKADKTKSIRHADKLRRNRPAEEEVTVPDVDPAKEVSDQPATESPEVTATEDVVSSDDSVVEESSEAVDSLEPASEEKETAEPASEEKVEASEEPSPEETVEPTEDTKEKK